MIDSELLVDILNGFKNIDDRDGAALKLKDILTSNGVSDEVASNIATSWHQGAYNRDLSGTVELIKNDFSANAVFINLVNNKKESMSKSNRNARPC